MRRAALRALLALVALGTLTVRAGDAVAPPHLVVGRIETLFPSTTTRAATALVDVPPGIRALHLFVRADGARVWTVEEGPIDAGGQFLEFLREEARAGSLHLVRPSPTAGLHRIVVSGQADARGGVAVEVEFDHDEAPPILDLRERGVPGHVRRFRLYVPPHEGVAELRGPATAGDVRIRLLGPRGDVGEDVELPASLDGTESGGMFVVEVLRGTAAALGAMRLFVSLAAGAPPAAPNRPTQLVLGKPITTFLGGHGRDEVEYLLVVPGDEPGGLVLTATVTEGTVDHHPDPDIYIRRGRPIDDPIADADYLGIGRGTSESVVLGGTAGLPSGEYFVRVQLVDAEQGGDVTVGATRPPSAVAREPAPIGLPLDEWTRGSIHAEASSIQWYAVRVPAEAASLHLQIVDATSDLDLFVVDPATGAIVARGVDLQIDECLSCRASSERRTRWRVGVASQAGSEDDVDFRIAAAADRAPTLPADLRLPPFTREVPLNEIETAASAVVEIEVKDGTGSGVCIDPRGYLLTCRHVVVDDESDAPTTGPILVAFPDDLRKAPRQAFKARVVESDADLDLALLRIETDVYGRPLAASPGLPFLALGDPGRAHLGDSLFVVGYPGDGSERSRTPVTVSRGIVSGLEAFRDQLLWIKTDAWIANGHSGGAALDADRRLIGLAAATLGSHDAMGLIRPVGLIPVRWLKGAGIDQKEPK